MTVQAVAEENKLQLLCNESYEAIDNEDGLQALRARAWDRFIALGLPTRKTEVFRYVPMRVLFAKEFCAAAEACVAPEQIEPFILPETKDSVLVFVNGFFQPSLSRTKKIPSKVSVLPMQDAFHSFGGFLTNTWIKSSTEETDPFVAMNAALHPRGAFLYIPPKTVVEQPIQILHITSTENSSLMMPRLHIFAGAQSDAKIVATHASLTTSCNFYNAVVDVHLEEDAHVKYIQDITNETEGSFHFHAYRASLKRNAVFKTIDVTQGSRSVRADYRAALMGENAEALLNNLWMLTESQEAHSHVLMDHQAPNCHSMQLFKGVLTDFSRSSFEGKILVRQAAQKTDAFQLNNNLLLSERSHADSKPNLEIFADDVKASHGATFGQLDEEHLFYLKSRGFSAAEAKNLLVYGYCKEILEMIFIPSLFEKLKVQAQRFLTKK